MVPSDGGIVLGVRVAGHHPHRVIREPPRGADGVLEAPDVIRLHVRIPSVESLQVLPGQYVDVLLEGGLRVPTLICWPARIPGARFSA